MDYGSISKTKIFIISVSAVLFLSAVFFLYKGYFYDDYVYVNVNFFSTIYE